MQDRAGASFAHDAQMQGTFIGRLSPMIVENFGVFIDQQNLLGSQQTLVHAAGTDRHSQRIATHDRTEITARPQYPAPGIE